MDAGQVAGLLVLLGVVGVLTAIVGSGIEAGPVKFPSIPVSRQKTLAVASVLVVAGGISWWVVQRQSTRNSKAATTNTPPSTGTLRVSLYSKSSDVHVGDDIEVAAEVFDSNNNQLGTGECELDWSDSATTWTRTTRCGPGTTEPSVTNPGVHRITAKAIGVRGTDARGSRTTPVTVRG